MKNSTFMQRLLAWFLFSNLHCLELEHKPQICWNFFTTVVSSCWNVQFMDGIGLSWRNSHQISMGAYMKNSHTNNDTSAIWFGFERAQSKHQCPVHLQWHHLTLKLNHRNHINYGKVCLQCCKFIPKHQMHYILPKTDAGQNIGWWIYTFAHQGIG